MECVEGFLHYASQCSATPPLFLHVAANCRTLYSALEIVARLLLTQSLPPTAFTPALPTASDKSSRAFFSILHGSVGTVPIAIHCQRLWQPWMTDRRTS